MSEFGQAVRHFWTLDWSATHLNHGSYGATPKPVLAAQDEVRKDMESTIGDFFSRQLPGRLRTAAGVLSTRRTATAREAATSSTAASYYRVNS